MRATAESPARERELLDAAREGDEGAFQRLIEPRRSELHAHCYRMLGSVHDAEDAYQDAMLRAWRGLSGFDGRASLRSWLYRIATNTCLDVINRRPKRVLPIDFGPDSDPAEVFSAPLVEEANWVEPYPDRGMGIEDGRASPEASYEQRESLELAFTAALQLLPPNQRAALILREVLGFSAKEVAATLETSEASVNSALQRARATIDKRLPDESQQTVVRKLGDEELKEIVDGYMTAMENHDVDAVVEMLTEDAVWSMPPAKAWFTGRERMVGFLERGPLSGEFRWKHRAAWANGQPAVGSYMWNDEAGAYTLFALDVFTLREDGKFADITSFITRTLDPERSLDTWADQSPDMRRVGTLADAFGLPAKLDD